MPSDTLPLPAAGPPHREDHGGGELIGQTLGERYRLISALGSGAMGDVYLAEHVVLGKRMAVKVLKRALCQSEELVQRFQQEAIAASRIGHENIVNVTDFGRTADGSLYFVMEALEGVNLRALLSRGPLEQSRVLLILLQLCRALTAAHGRGIIHRDLKLDNVMLVPREDGSEVVKVLDFGISKVADPKDAAEQKRLTQAGVVLGTPDYMSPEQIRGEPVDHRTDIYAFGVIGHELATGVLPFVAPNVTGVMMMHLAEVVRAPSARWPELGLSRAFDTLVLRSLEKNREQRFQSMGEVRESLGLCLEAIGSGPAMTPPPRRIPQRATPLPAALVIEALPDTYSRPADPEAVKAAVARAREARAPSPSRLPLLLGFLLAAGAGALGLRLLERPAAPAVAAPAVVAPPPVVLAPPPPVVVVPPVPAPPPVVRPQAPVPERLGGRDIGRVFGQSQTRVRKCLLDNRALLSSASGRLEVSFTVLDSGAVSEASVKTPLDPIISSCVVSRFKEMRFPKHLERTQSFDLPFDYAFKD